MFINHEKWDVPVGELAERTPRGVKIDNPIKTIYMYPDGHYNVEWRGGHSWTIRDAIESPAFWSELFLRPLWKLARSTHRKSGKPTGGSIYQPIADYLDRAADDTTETTLTIGQMEQILGREFPPSATDYPEWWYGSKHNVPAWRKIGWHPYPKPCNGKIVQVRFVRQDPAPTNLEMGNTAEDEDEEDV